MRSVLVVVAADTLANGVEELELIGIYSSLVAIKFVGLPRRRNRKTR